MGQSWPISCQICPTLGQLWSSSAEFGSTLADFEPDLGEFGPNVVEDGPNVVEPRGIFCLFHTCVGRSWSIPAPNRSKVAAIWSIPGQACRHSDESGRFRTEVAQFGQTPPALRRAAAGPEREQNNKALRLCNSLFNSLHRTGRHHPNVACDAMSPQLEGSEHRALAIIAAIAAP